MSDDADAVQRLLHLAGFGPAPVWGRDEHLTGDMWNSNSAISWLLIHSGIPAEEIEPPPGGQAGKPAS